MRINMGNVLSTWKKFSYDDCPLPSIESPDNVYIRILHLQPPEPLFWYIRWLPAYLHSYFTPLKGHLETILLGDGTHPDYNALSYVWGPPDASARIIVDGKGLPITPSLAESLRYLRPTTTTLALWIDQICINQNDDQEKSIQVGFMDKIYRSSKECVVWLGPPADGSDDLMDLLIQIGTFAEEFDILGYFTKFKLPVLRKILAKDDPDDPITTQYHDYTDEVAPLFTYERYASLIAFQKRSWFQRVWVLQEFTMPKEVTMMCGAKRLRAEAMIAVLWMIESTINNKRLSLPPNDDDLRGQVTQLIGQNPFSPFSPSRRRRKACEQGRSKGDTLYEILYRAYSGSFLEATQACDKIFALLGVASDRLQLAELGLRIDYAPAEKTPSKVFTRATRALVKLGNVEILLSAQHFKSILDSSTTPSSQRSQGLWYLYDRFRAFDRTNIKEKVDEDETLPSWVPDWRKPVRPSFGWMPGNITDADFRSLFSASKGMELDVVERGDDGSLLDDGSLALKGYRVDVIEQTGCVWEGVPEYTKPDQFPWKEYLIYLEQVDRMCQLARKIPGTKLIDAEAEWRVPVGDIEYALSAGGSIRASSSWKKAYDECRAHLEFNYDLFMISLSEEVAKSRLSQLTHTKYGSQWYRIQMKGLKGKRPFISKHGYVGLGPEAMLLGDVVVIIAGSTIPFVVRPAGDGNFWLVGECYCHGIMDGEIVESKKIDGVDPEVFVLI